MGMYIGFGSAKDKPEGAHYFGCSNSASKKGSKESKAITVESGDKSLKEVKVRIFFVTKGLFKDVERVEIYAASEVKGLKVVVGDKSVLEHVDKGGTFMSNKDMDKHVFGFVVPAKVAADFLNEKKGIKLIVEYNNGKEKEVILTQNKSSRVFTR